MSATKNAPLEPKVAAASVASGLVAFLAVVVSSIAQDQNTSVLLGFLPEALEPFVVGLLATLAPLAVGWLTAHQYREGEGATARRSD